MNRVTVCVRKGVETAKRTAETMFVVRENYVSLTTVIVVMIVISKSVAMIVIIVLTSNTIQVAVVIDVEVIVAFACAKKLGSWL